jgi:error-prone DNA polymerase
VPIFQEQAMKIAIEAARFNSAEANALRKAMATFRSRGTIGKLEEMMVGRMVERGYDRAFAMRCFNQIKGFGEYGFPESHAASFALLVYVSSWLKCHHPAAFACALLNSQPMGFYAPAQIVRDAREHGVDVRPADVNYSDWDNTLEPGARGWALRLGLRQIDGMPRAMADRLITGRDAPYADLETLHRAAGLNVATLRRLAAADAFRSMGLDRRAALWATRALRDAPDLPLFAGQRDEGAEQAFALPAMPVCEHVVADYQTLRLSLKAHPMAFLRASMARQGYHCAADLDRTRNGQRLRLAGLVLIRQRPGSAKGVCFITLEDETGVANLVVWPKVMAAFRKVIMTARLLDLTGHLQRDALSGVTHVVVQTLSDRSDALFRLAHAPFAAPLSRADEVTRPIPQPSRGHPRNATIIPKSRDFH